MVAAVTRLTTGRGIAPWNPRLAGSFIYRTRPRGAVMMDDLSKTSAPAAEEQRDLTLIATLVGIIIVCGGLFIFNSASTKYTTASYRAPPALNNVPIMP